MAIGLVGRKCGMTQYFAADGKAIPVTVVEVKPLRVTQVKNHDKEGYHALQMTTGSRSAKYLTKGELGHFVKANIEAGEGLWEFTIEKNENSLAVGSELKVDFFKVGQKVDVTGTSKGKGYGGVIKRHHFATQDATHGNSLSHRAPGSIGQRQSPGRVFKGKRMAGQLGNHQTCLQSLEVIQIDIAKNLILIKGAIPGAPGGRLVIKPAVRFKNKVVN